METQAMDVRKVPTPQTASKTPEFSAASPTKLRNQYQCKHQGSTTLILGETTEVPFTHVPCFVLDPLRFQHQLMQRTLGLRLSLQQQLKRTRLRMHLSLQQQLMRMRRRQ